jgi:hypothetical protein
MCFIILLVATEERFWVGLVRSLGGLLAGAAHFHDLLLLAGEFGLEAAELFAQLGCISAR